MGSASFIVFTEQFRTIAEACEHLPPDTLLDGEIIALDANGRISFNQLQHHLTSCSTIVHTHGRSCSTHST